MFIIAPSHLISDDFFKFLQKQRLRMLHQKNQKQINKITKHQKTYMEIPQY